MKWLDTLSWPTLAILAGVLGLAPFSPEPHVWEKLKMLAEGELGQPIDIFDLLMHGAPFVLLGLKAVRDLSGKKS